MIRKFLVLIAVGFLTVGASAQQPPLVQTDPRKVTWQDLVDRHNAEVRLLAQAQAPQVKATPQAPQVKAAKPKRPRGARPTPRHKIFQAKKYVPKAATISY